MPLVMIRIVFVEQARRIEDRNRGQATTSH
jgi:hypothetical protein